MGIGRVWLIGTLVYMSKPCSRRALDIYSTRRKRAQCTTAFFSHGSSKGAGGGHDPFRLHGLAWQECGNYGAAKRVAPEIKEPPSEASARSKHPLPGLQGSGSEGRVAQEPLHSGGLHFPDTPKSGSVSHSMSDTVCPGKHQTWSPKSCRISDSMSDS